MPQTSSPMVSVHIGKKNYFCTVISNNEGFVVKDGKKIDILFSEPPSKEQINFGSVKVSSVSSFVEERADKTTSAIAANANVEKTSNKSDEKHQEHNNSTSMETTTMTETEMGTATETETET